MGDKGKQERSGEMGDKWRQDLGEGGHTIQHQGGHLKKASRTPNPTKGNKNGYNVQWETKGNKKEGVQWETSGDKTLGKAGTPFNTKAATLRRH